jgi:hypothetical protein
LDERRDLDDRPQFVRDNGTVKYGCRYAGAVGSSINAHHFDWDGKRTSVYEYYRARYPRLAVAPSDRAVYVQDRRGRQTLAVPASRLFPVFTTESDLIRRCSVSPQLAPAERLEVIRSFLEMLQGIAYGDARVSLDLSPWRGPRTVFIPPRLQFGDGVIVQPFPGGSTPLVTSRDFDNGVTRFGGRKIHAVDRGRPFFNEPIPDVTLVYPESLTREHREQFLSILNAAVEQRTGRPIRVREQLAYATGQGQREGAALMRRAEQLRARDGRGVVLVVLWGGFGPAVHGGLKAELDTIPSQCVTDDKVREIAVGGDPHRLESLLRNLSLALLTEVGQMPWVLADALHHDLHLGVDLLHGRIGFHGLYGHGGRHVWSEFGTAVQRGRMHEQIKAPELQRRVEHFIRAVAEADQLRRHLALHRDGRWWESEHDGLQAALDTLLREGIVPTDFRVTVAEIRKNHLPVRLFTHIAPSVDSAGLGGMINPIPGCCLELDAQRAVLTTTGRPGSWDGKRRGRTASTLMIDIVDHIGDASPIAHVAEDAYRLTHLNWNAPDIEIALPVTIRWADRLLREPLRREAVQRRERVPSHEGVA